MFQCINYLFIITSSSNGVCIDFIHSGFYIYFCQRQHPRVWWELWEFLDLLCTTLRAIYRCFFPFLSIFLLLFSTWKQSQKLFSYFFVAEVQAWQRPPGWNLHWQQPRRWIRFNCFPIIALIISFLILPDSLFVIIVSVADYGEVQSGSHGHFNTDMNNGNHNQINE